MTKGITGVKNILIALGIVAVSQIASFTSVSAAYFNSAPLVTCDAPITSTLYYGSENDEVYTLQSILAQMGYLRVAPNGYFGPSTRQAVINFQRDQGLVPTGFVGPATRDLLSGSSCNSYSTSNNVYYYNNYSTYPYGTTYNYNGYGYNTNGTTYVDPQDPYVRVISPTPSTPVVYPSTYTTNSIPSTITPVTYTPSSQGQVSGITYNSYIGYTYTVIPMPGILTIASPSANAVYNEGDTVYVSWGTSNLTANSFEVYLENSSTGQKRVVAVTSGNSASFILTRDLLDQLCTGSCTQSFAQGSFKVVIATPVTDIAGVTSVFRAQVSPLTINRPYSYFGTVSITGSKNPVNSGELFKLYVNIPTGASWNANIYGQYSIRIRATCPNGIDVRVGGTPCGQDFILPYAPTYLQQEIPTVITNPTWYRQDVTFTLTVTDLAGRTIGQAQTVVSGNAAPLNWP